jgi:hypothetical protein
LRKKEKQSIQKIAFRLKKSLITEEKNVAKAMKIFHVPVAKFQAC